VAKRISEEEARSLYLENNLEPVEPVPGTQKPWKSKCLVTLKIVSPTYGKVRVFGHRCEYCSGYKVDEADALLAMENANFRPLVAYPGANQPWESECLKCGKVTHPRYSTVLKGVGCKFCAHRAVDPTDAISAMLQRGLRTLEPFPGATKDWLVECINCKKQFKTYLHSLNTSKGCKFCAGVAVSVDDLLSRLSELNLQPLEDFKTAKTPWKCKCLVCGHLVQPTWMRIKQGRGHCAYCSQRRVDVPEALNFMKSVGLMPLVEFPGSKVPWKSKCLKCEREVHPRWSDLRSGQGGCSSCADYGLDYQSPGYFYLITNDALNAHKVGIANSYKGRKYDDRMYNHRKQGWKLFKKLEFNTVKEAYDVEAKVLKWLRLEVGLPIALDANQMPQGGHTETVNASEIDLQTIWAKVINLSKVKE
jgi:hypothetical protein